MGRSRRWCLLTAIMLLAVARSAFAVRIAVVGDGGEAAGRTVELAQAQMTGDAGVQFVERQAIKRILDEQKLSLSGIVSAQQAVQVGKILGADLLAVVEKQEEAAGVVVFDTRTGVRLCDQALGEADEKTATGLAEALRESVRKMDVPVGKQRPICLLTVRNVDLPKADDAFCQAVARLTERRLLGAPEVVLLERERLDALRKEHELAPADAQTSSLVAAVILLELQVARDESGAIRSTCVLTDNQGKRGGNPATAVSRSRQADELATALANDIARTLQVGAPARSDDPAARRAEAARFYREAQFWWAHEDYEHPVAALEAAVALDPDNAILRAEMARALILEGMACVAVGLRDEGKAGYVFLKQNFNAQEVTESLNLVEVGLRRLLQETGSPASSPAEKLHQSSLKLIAIYLERIESRQEPGTAPGIAHRPFITLPEHIEAVRQLRGGYEAFHRISNGAPSVWEAKDWHGAVAATGALQDMLMDQDFYKTATREEVIRDIVAHLTGWRDMCRRVPPTGSPSIRAIAQLLSPGRLEPALVGEFRQAYTAISAADREKVLGIYEVLGQINDPACIAVADAGRAWVGQTSAKDLIAKERPINQVPRRVATLLVAGRGGTPATTTAPAWQFRDFWKERRLLLDVSANKLGELQTLYPAIPFENTIYVAGAMKTTRYGQPVPKLIRIELTHLPAQHFESPGVERDEGIAIPQWNNVMASIAGGYYILLDKANLPLTLFPLDGAAPVVLDSNRGFHFVADTATVLGGKVYAAGIGNQGLFIEYDLATRAVRTLAASKRTDIHSPFDNQPPMRVPFMIADPARDRIVFSAWAPKWSKDLAGLWEFNVKTAKFKPLNLAKYDIGDDRRFYDSDRLFQAGPVLHDKCILNAPGANGMFDLSTDQLSPVPQLSVWEKPNVTTGTATVAVGDRFLWTTWGRAALPKGPVQEFPNLRAAGPNNHPRGFVPLSDDRLVAFDYTTLWLVSPRDETVPSGMPKFKDPALELPPPITPPEGGQLPWDSVHIVYDHIRDIEKTELYVAPRAVGRDIFVLGMGHDLPKELRPRSGDSDDVLIGFAQLLRYSRDGGPVKFLGRLAVTGVQEEQPPNARMTGGPANYPAAVALDDHTYYAAMHGESCIGVFPFDGSPARKIALDGRPNHLAVLDGQLYAAWQQSFVKDRPMLVRIDPRTGKSETLLTSAAEGAQWRGQYYPRIHGLWTDAPRHRLLYLAQGRAPDPQVDGIWELKAASGEKRLLLPLFMTEAGNDPFTSSSVFWTGANADGNILVLSSRGLFAFDPATDKATLVMQRNADLNPLATAPGEPAAPHAPVPHNDLLNGSVSALESPCVIQDGYLWYNFGRVSVDGKLYEKFPELRPRPSESARGFGPIAFQFLDGGKELLVHDLYGAFVLNLRR